MTYSSRRGFVVGGMVVAAGTGVAGCSGGSDSGSVVTPIAGSTPTPTAVALNATEISAWEKLVGSAFLISTDTGRVSAVLASLERITDATRPSDLGRHQPFFATFQMDQRQTPAGGKTYEVSHTTTGAFQLFLGMPSEVQGKGVLTAVLN